MKTIKRSMTLAFIFILFSMNAKAQVIDDVVSAEVTASRSKVYINEEFQITIAITSTGVSLDQQFQLAGMPETNKLVCKEFKELPAERNMQGNLIRERRRFCCEAKSTAPGILEIGPTLRIGLVSGFGLFRQISRFEIRAKTLSLSVMPLPDTGRPAGFSGALGQFGLDVEVSPSDVAVGDLVTVTTRIRGRGYLDPVTVINISPGANFKVYPAKAVPGSSPEEKIFEQILVPQNTNATIIPPVSFSFFDPLRDRYMTAVSGPFPVRFHPQSKASLQEIYKPDRSTAKGGIQNGRLLTSETKGISWGMPVFMTAAIAFYWTVVVVLLLWITLYFTRGSKVAIGVFLIAAALFLPFRNMISRRNTGLNTAMTVRTEKARLAPAYSAIVSFNVQRDSTLKVVEIYGSWSKIQVGDKKGWLPSDALTNSIAEK